MKSIKQHIENQFFIITKSNMNSVKSRLYGVCYLNQTILANCSLQDAVIDPASSGCFTAVKVDEAGNIRIFQDLCSSTYIYYFDNGSYWAISNSFFMLCDEVKKHFSLTINEDFFEILYSTKTCAYTEIETLAKEIKAVPFGVMVDINSRDKSLSFVKNVTVFDALEKKVQIDSAEGMALIDGWISRWSSIIRWLYNNNHMIKIDLSGGFDSRTAFALTLAAGISYESSNVHVYSDHNSKSDYEIACNIAGHYGIQISNNSFTEGSVEISGYEVYEIYHRIFANVHREAYFPNCCYKKPIFHINGINGEVLHGWGENSEAYMRRFFDFLPEEGSLYPVKAWKKFSDDWENISDLSDDEELNDKEKDSLFYLLTMNRAHGGLSMFQNYVLNCIQVTSFVDLDILRIARAKGYGSHLINAVIISRIDPHLLDYPIHNLSEQSFTRDEIEYAKKLCEKYKSQVQISEIPYTLICNPIAIEDLVGDGSISPLKILEDQFEDPSNKELFISRFKEYGKKIYSGSEKAMRNRQLRHSNQYAAVIVSAMKMLQIERQSDRYYGNNMARQDQLILEGLMDMHSDNTRLEKAYRDISSFSRKIIVSLTSYPPRIGTVHKTLKTLLIQNRKPDKILLWLAKEQFPGREDDLPKSLLELMEYGVEIRWCDDLKSHKKYFYTMQEYPEDIVITVDDDVYYSPQLIEALINSYVVNQNAVSCAVSNRIKMSDGRICEYESWPHNDRLYAGVPQMDIMPVGVGGVLYPPGILPKETFDKEAILELCIKQDDLWLKAMEIISGIPTVLVKDNLPYPESIKEAQSVGLYLTINQSENDEALKRIATFIDKKAGREGVLVDGIRGFGPKTGESIDTLDGDYNDLLYNKLNDGFFIYGAGVGAGMVMECLQSINSNLIPRAFVVTSMNGNTDEIYGCPVVEIGKMGSELTEYPMIVSAGEKKHSDIIATLDQYNTGERLFIKDAVMGKMLHGKKEIGISKEMFAFSILK